MDQRRRAHGARSCDHRQSRLCPLVLLSLATSTSAGPASRDAWPGASSACNRGQAALESAISGELSAFRAANTDCLNFCNPTSGTSCDADCSQGLDALQTACHSDSAHVYRTVWDVGFRSGVRQDVSAYVCLAGSCNSADVMLYAAWQEVQRCSPLDNLTFVDTCAVSAVIDDVISDSEAAARVTGAVLVAFAVVAIVVVAVLAWRRWHAQAKAAALGGGEEAEMTPILPAGPGHLGLSSTAGGSLPGCQNTPGAASAFVVAGNGSAHRQAPTHTESVGISGPVQGVAIADMVAASGAPVLAARGHASSVNRGSFSGGTSESSFLSVTQGVVGDSGEAQPLPRGAGSTREDVFKSRYGASSARPPGAAPHAPEGGGSPVNPALAPLLPAESPPHYADRFGVHPGVTTTAAPTPVVGGRASFGAASTGDPRARQVSGQRPGSRRY